MAPTPARGVDKDGRRIINNTGAGRRMIAAGLLIGLALVGWFAGSVPAQQEEESATTTWPLCRADLVVAPGEACRYPRRSDHFVVRSTGEGRLFFFRDLATVQVPGWRIDGQIAHFLAHAQGDGSWLIESVDPEPEVAPDLGGVVELADSHGTPTGMWHDDEHNTLWLLENTTGAADAIYGYPLVDTSPPKVVELAVQNAQPRGLWSDGLILWVSDSAADRVFSYIFVGTRRGIPIESSEFALAADNAEPRGIWSDGEVLWVLDAGVGALFAYNLADGSPLGRHALDPANASPHGLWSDGDAVWVSDHERARLFAYLLPQVPAESAALKRSPGDDVAALADSGNASPRGVWSDGQMIYVADANDDIVYSYPMPPSIRSAVAALARRGIFAGAECDTGLCPGEPISRQTMAVWTVRMLDGQDPPPVTESRFNDVDATDFHAPFIERMAALGVTSGCGDGSGFCPNRTVTRAQTAAFMSRAYNLPDAPDPGFTDVDPDAWFAADVARLAASKITLGCGDGSGFCPHRNVTRGQMAAFLHRADQLPK